MPFGQTDTKNRRENINVGEGGSLMFSSTAFPFVIFDKSSVKYTPGILFFNFPDPSKLHQTSLLSAAQRTTPAFFNSTLEKTFCALV